MRRQHGIAGVRGGARPERYKLPSARHLEPLYQGDNSSLCGLYAIINALRLATEPLRPLSMHNVRGLYRAGVEFLEAEKALVASFCAGMDATLWRRLSKHLHSVASEATGLRVVQHRPFLRQPRVRRSDVLVEIERRLLREQPVICELGGAYNHYTVICGYTPTNLLLFDSYGYARVATAACGLRRPRSTQRHQLHPSTIVVSGAEV